MAKHVTWTDVRLAYLPAETPLEEAPFVATAEQHVAALQELLCAGWLG